MFTNPPKMSEIPHKSEAQRLKSLAESELLSHSLLSALNHAQKAENLSPDLAGLSQLLTTLKILTSNPHDHYHILLLPPFSAPSTIRKQYKALALSLHPDKSSATVGDSSPAAGDAFKRVADSFRFLSDRFRKQDYDLRLRLALAGEAARKDNNLAAGDTFSSVCDLCKDVHEFERSYVGFRLVCPSCKKSFLAVEVSRSGEFAGNERVCRPRSGLRNSSGDSVGGEGMRRPVGFAEKETRSSRPEMKRRDEVKGTPDGKKARVGQEKTLAEIQMEIAKAREKAKEKAKGKEGGVRENGRRRNVKEKCLGDLMVKEEQENVMAVVDSDFYDFDDDRTEKSLRKGQVWALYDDDDGMPRHYGLIEEVVSSRSFRVKMNWLDIQVQGNEELMHWEKSGYHISCGRFKIGKTADISCVNFFSHLVNCERATRDVYRIYPRKGSVWALYVEESLGVEKGRNYDVVVSLTSYSEMYGLSIAFLEKVKGYRSVFRRKAVGCHAIKWLEKGDFRLFSHEIPAQKISETQSLDLPGEYWELDPASLPPELLTIDWSGK